jgi:HPt (histidine-containing phosphotransfer) domain-containing protein/two-component sensor histidine kinase
MKPQSLERNLIALSVTTGVVLCVLLLSLFGVEYALGARLEQLQSETLPAEQATVRLEQAVARLFEREVRVQATQSNDQLAALRDRHDIDDQLAHSERVLKDTLPDIVDAEQARRLSASLDAKSLELLQTDQRLFDSIERRHKAQEALDRQSSELSADLQNLAREARAVSGNAHLEYVLQLRRIAVTAAPADVQKVVYGEERAQQEAAEQVLIAVLQLGQIVGEIALSRSTDELNSIAANELTQNLLKGRTRLLRLLANIDAHSASFERANAMKPQFEAVAARIADEQDAQSLMRIRRQILEEAVRAQELQGQLLRTETDFSKSLRETQRVVAAEAVRSTSSARTTQWLVRVGTLCLLGAAAWFGWRAARRVKESVTQLRAQNEHLEGLSTKLTGMNEGLEWLVAERSAELEDREKHLRLVLDAMEEGLMTVTLDGRLSGECSHAAVSAFGRPEAGARVWTYLFGESPEAAESFEVSFTQVTDQILPFEAAVACLPARLERERREFSLEYRPIYEGSALKNVLVVALDVTARALAERGERYAREQHTLLSNLIRDKQGFQVFLQDCRALLQELRQDANDTEKLLALHTLKGTTATYGLESVAQDCHELETALAEGTQANPAERFELIGARFEDRVYAVEEMLGGDSSIELSELDFGELTAGLKSRKSADELLGMVDSWRWLQTSRMLARLSAQARRVVARLEKTVEVVVEHNELRIAPGPLDEFLPTLVHVVRNALDHGIESGAERQVARKPRLGRLTLRSYLRRNSELVLEIEDDGRGIDYSAIARAAQRVGVPARTSAELQEAMLVEGVTTCEQVSETSGRGVGLGAVARACRKAGGAIEISSEVGRGTTFRFVFPREVVSVRKSHYRLGGRAHATPISA